MDTVGFGNRVDGADDDRGLHGCHDGGGNDRYGGDTGDQKGTAGADARAETEEADDELHDASYERDDVDDLGPFRDDGECV